MIFENCCLFDFPEFKSLLYTRKFLCGDYSTIVGLGDDYNKDIKPINHPIINNIKDGLNSEWNRFINQIEMDNQDAISVHKGHSMLMKDEHINIPDEFSWYGNFIQAEYWDYVYVIQDYGWVGLHIGDNGRALYHRSIKGYENYKEARNQINLYIRNKKIQKILER